MPLIRLDHDSFSVLERQWAGQCQSYGESFAEFAPERVDHARKICGENPPEERYGIYSVMSGQSFDALIHVNRANIPGPAGLTLRMLWMLFAPKFDFEEVDFKILSTLFAEIINDSINLSAEKKCQNLKIHLGNLADRQFFAGVASGLKMNSLFSDVRLVGNWFHLSHN